MDDDQASRATRRGAVARMAEATVSRSLGRYARSSSPSGSELGVRIGEGGATARPSSDIPGTTRGLGVTTRKDARRSCSAARGRRSRGSSCAVPGRRRGGARRPPWRACSRRAAAWRRRTRASSAGRVAVARDTTISFLHRFASVSVQRGYATGTAPPLRIDGEARCSDPCDWAPRVQRAQSEALLLSLWGRARRGPRNRRPHRRGRASSRRAAGFRIVQAKRERYRDSARCGASTKVSIAMSGSMWLALRKAPVISSIRSVRSSPFWPCRPGGGRARGRPGRRGRGCALLW